MIPRLFVSMALCAPLCLGTLASAHPHVFADTNVTFVFADDGMLHALQIVWTYDELTSLVLFDTLDLDHDRDGVLDDADRAKIVAGETQWEPDYNGDIHLRDRMGPVPMGRPQDGAARMERDRISVSFTLPLARPMPAQGMELSLYDPIYYYAYAILPESGAKNAPDGCATVLDPFKADDTTADLRAELAKLSQEETPEIENVGALFADKLRLTCQ